MKGRRHVVALALVAVQVAASVATFEHEAAVRHVVCAEHGELLDLPASNTDSPVARADADALGSRGDPARALDHQHCALAPAIEDTVAPAPYIAVAAPAPVARIVAIAPPAFAIHSIPPLSVAPKTDPPG